MLSVGISSLGHTKLIFIDPVVKVNGSYYRLTTRSGEFCKSECIVTRLVTLTIWKNDWFMNLPLRSACHWQSSCPVATHHVYAILFTVWFLS